MESNHKEVYVFLVQHQDGTKCIQVTSSPSLDLKRPGNNATAIAVKHDGKLLLLTTSHIFDDPQRDAQAQASPAGLQMGESILPIGERQTSPEVQLIGTASLILRISRHECALLEVVDPKTKLMIDDAIPLRVSQTETYAHKAAVEAVTPNDGLISGEMSTDLIIEEIFLREGSYRLFYGSDFGRPFVFGYYGSWVRDKESNLLYGFIVEGVKDSTLFKLTPAKEIFKDVLAAYT